MSIMSEDVEETDEKAAVRTPNLKNPATGRAIKPALTLKRNMKRRREVAGAASLEGHLAVIVNENDSQKKK